MILLSWFAHAQVHPDYFLQKAAKSYQDKHFEMAIDNARRTLNLDSSEQKAYYILSSSYLQQSNWSEAIASAKLGLQHFPKVVGLHWLLAEGALQSKSFQLAAHHFEQVKNSFSGQTRIGNISSEKLNLRLGECYTQMGNGAVQQGNKKLALDYFKKANHLLEDNAFSYVNLAFAYASLTQWENSLNTAEKGLVQFPDNDGLIKAKASALYQQKDYQGVEKEYAKLYRSNPDDLETAIAYGELLMANQQFQKASELYNELLKKHPKEKKIYESLITSYELRLNYEGKVGILRQMLPHFDKKAIYQRIAATYEDIEKWDKARKYYDTLLILQPDNAFEIEQKLANTYSQQDSLNQAAQHYEDLYRRRPENVSVLKNLAWVYEKNQKWEESLQNYQKLEALEQSAWVYSRLGAVNQRLNEEAVALKYYRKSLAYQENPEALLGISTIIKPSQPDSALHMAEEAFTIAFTKLSQYESRLNSKLGDNKSMASLIGNKELLKEIEAYERLATDAFHQLAAFDFNVVNRQITSLVDEFPKSARVYYLVGEFNYKNHHKERAMSLLQRSAQLNANFKDTHVLLGAIYEERQQYYQSILSYERALTLDNKDDDIYTHLIRLYKSYDKLDLLCDKWIAKYEAAENQEVLRQHLIEVLHKAGKFELAQKIIEENKNSQL